MSIRIRNEMPNLHLTVDGIQICNIHLSGIYHSATESKMQYWQADTTRSSLGIETGRLKLNHNEEILFPKEESIPFIPQPVKAWKPTSLPQYSEACYMLLNCKVFDKVIKWSDEKGNCAEVAIPLSVHFQNNQE